jgi:hypothetical protein
MLVVVRRATVQPDRREPDRSMHCLPVARLATPDLEQTGAVRVGHRVDRTRHHFISPRRSPLSAATVALGKPTVVRDAPEAAR